MRNKLIATGVLATVMLLGGVSMCERVPPGYEGVVVNMHGGGKGVQELEKQPGWTFIPPGKELYKFPTFTQNIVWTLDPEEGSRNDESITYQDNQGLELNADIGVSYFVIPGKSDQLFVKYRRGIDEITDVFMRNMVRDAFVKYSSGMTAEEAYSTRKSELIQSVQQELRDQLTPLGIEVEKVFYTGPIRLPRAVKAAIDGKIEATQLAQKAENQIQQAAAEAQKKVEAANGLAQSVILESEARAKAIILEGEALRANPEVLTLREIEKWNGEYPSTLVVGGESSPFLLLEDKK